MTDDDRTTSANLAQYALDATDHPNKAVTLLMTADITIPQRRYGAEMAVEHVTHALDVAGADRRRAMYGGA